jgi:hypothetical protein
VVVRGEGVTQPAPFPLLQQRPNSYSLTGCHTGPPTYVAWRAGTTVQLYARVDYLAPVRNYEFGY